jgi:hypothetical protein
VSFAAITLCVASEQVFSVVSLYVVMDSVRKLLDTSSYTIYICDKLHLVFFPKPQYKISISTTVASRNFVVYNLKIIKSCTSSSPPVTN